jgi:hypothetical protein
MPSGMPSHAHDARHYCHSKNGFAATAVHEKVRITRATHSVVQIPPLHTCACHPLPMTGGPEFPCHGLGR